MITQKPQESLAEIKVNFMKSEEKMALVGSKVYNKTNSGGEVRFPADVTDGLNMFVNFDDEDKDDMTDILKGLTVNVRINREMWEDLNARFHEMEDCVGARITFKIDGDVVWNTLTIRGEERESYTLYVDSILSVEEVKVQRLTSKRGNKAEFLAKARKERQLKEQSAEAARAQNQAARNSVETKEAQQLSMNFG